MRTLPFTFVFVCRVFTNVLRSVIEHGGAKVVIDFLTLDMIKGATLTFKNDLAKQAFEVTENPNASNTCGCKTSFDVKAKT